MVVTNMETLTRLILANPKALERAQVPCCLLGLWEEACEGSLETPQVIASVIGQHLNEPGALDDLSRRQHLPRLIGTRHPRA
jgi:hypothetical protein